MEKPKTANLDAFIQGENLNIFQKADAIIEYNRLKEYVELLENKIPKEPKTVCTCSSVQDVSWCEKNCH